MRDETKRTFAEWRAHLERELTETEKLGHDSEAEVRAAEAALEAASATYQEIEALTRGRRNGNSWLANLLHDVSRTRSSASGDLVKAKLGVENAQARCADIKAALAHLDEIAPVIPAEAAV